MNDRQRFADWLVANQDKKGTKEYQTVANAFRDLDRPQNKDGAIAYSVDSAQKMAGSAAHQLGTAFGWDSVADWGRDYVTKQNKEIKAILSECLSPLPTC